MSTQTTSTAADRKARPGKFVWFEHSSRETKKAQAFYGELLGWKAQRWNDTPYEMILAGKSMDTMIGGYTAPAHDDDEAQWISYVSVEDVDAAAKAAAANGGRVLEAPHDLPGVGRAARIADPQGAELYVFKNAGGDPPDPPAGGPPPWGRFFWDELHTPKPEDGVSFYEKVVGFTHETMDMGPAGSYFVLSRDGVGRGGVSGHVEGESHWLPYVAVDDPDGTVARAEKLGAETLVGPADIPGVGRFAVLQDPLGAKLAIMKPNPSA